MDQRARSFLHNAPTLQPGSGRLKAEGRRHFHSQIYVQWIRQFDLSSRQQSSSSATFFPYKVNPGASFVHCLLCEGGCCCCCCCRHCCCCSCCCCGCHFVIAVAGRVTPSDHLSETLETFIKRIGSLPRKNE